MASRAISGVRLFLVLFFNDKVLSLPGRSCFWGPEWLLYLPQNYDYPSVQSATNNQPSSSSVGALFFGRHEVGIQRKEQKPFPLAPAPIPLATPPVLGFRRVSVSAVHVDPS